tara:strand:+ start:442 stop:795 length:354 start_codon:yes stop_codon:yes gene_type:complete
MTNKANPILNNQLEVVENILKDALDSIHFVSNWHNDPIEKAGFANDEVIQSIDECEIYINDALEELEQFKYHYNSEDENQKYQNDVIPAEESSLYDEEFSFQDHEDETVGPKTGYED